MKFTRKYKKVSGGNTLCIKRIKRKKTKKTKTEEVENEAASGYVFPEREIEKAQCRYVQEKKKKKRVKVKCTGTLAWAPFCLCGFGLGLVEAWKGRWGWVSVLTHEWNTAAERYQ